MDETPPGPPFSGASPDPLPESVNISPGLVEDWLALPPEAPISVDLRRVDLDHFYNSINRCIEAQYVFQDCMIDFTAGRLDAANAKLRQSQRRLIEAQNALRQFMTTIMVSSTRKPRA